jgi:hypothetical protein
MARHAEMGLRHLSQIGCGNSRLHLEATATPLGLFENSQFISKTAQSRMAHPGPAPDNDRTVIGGGCYQNWQKPCVSVNPLWGDGQTRLPFDGHASLAGRDVLEDFYRWPTPDITHP